MIYNIKYKIIYSIYAISVKDLPFSRARVLFVASVNYFMSQFIAIYFMCGKIITNSTNRSSDKETECEM